MNIDTWMHIWHSYMKDMPRNDIMTKAHHVMVKPHHVMVKPHHIMIKPHHIMVKPRHIMTKPHHVMVKLHHVITNDHIRKLWLSIFVTVSRKSYNLYLFVFQLASQFRKPDFLR